MMLLNEGQFDAISRPFLMMSCSEHNSFCQKRGEEKAQLRENVPMMAASLVLQLVYELRSS